MVDGTMTVQSACTGRCAASRDGTGGVMAQDRTRSSSVLTFWLPLLAGGLASAAVLFLVPQLWWAGAAVLVVALAVCVGLGLRRDRRAR